MDRKAARPSGRAGSGVVGEAVGAGVQVALLWEAGGSPGCRSVGAARSLSITGHLHQVGVDGVEAVVFGDSFVGLERREQVETGLGAPGHGDRDGVVQPHHGLFEICSSSS